MTKRTYHQYCPTAYSLDIIGERWTLLIVRDLLSGPRRYTDLLNGLPGIGTNLLAQRLKDLEKADIIHQQTLPPPSASKVYALTERGRGLEPILQAINDWGINYVTKPPSGDDYLGIVPLKGLLRMFFDPAAAAAVNLCVEFHCHDEVFTVIIRNGAITVEASGTHGADLSAQTDPKTLLMLVRGQMSPVDAPITLLHGDNHALKTFIACFRSQVVPEQPET